MTLNQFRLLNELEKVSAILEFGTLLAQDVDSGTRMFLYKIETFYVSASYGPEDDNLSGITCFLEVDQAVPHFRKKLILINPAEREYQVPEA